MTDADNIVCARFTLVPFTLEFIDALLRHDAAAAERVLGITLASVEWIDSNERHLRMRRDDLVSDPGSQPWLARAIILPDGSMVGRIGFHGRPDAEGVAELGYDVFEPYRRQHYALEAVTCMMAWARERGARRFRLSIAPDNAPSLALAARLGFARAGEHIDEFDGLELIFERDAA
jgi:RimJ/RimL family protein N-acetyltransferase